MAYACSGVTYHLHFWQKTGVFYMPLQEHRVERTPNKSQHRKLTLEKKILLPCLLRQPCNLLITSPALYQQAIPLHNDKNNNSREEKRFRIDWHIYLYLSKSIQSTPRKWKPAINAHCLVCILTHSHLHLHYPKHLMYPSMLILQ